MKSGVYDYRRRWLPLLALCALGAARPARAGDGSPSSALVLPAQVKGAVAGQGKTWDTRMAERLSAYGIAPLSEKVTTSEARCADRDCLSSIAKTHHADLVARAIVTEVSGGLRLRLVLLRAGEATPRDEESVCAGCSPEAAIVRFDEMLDRAMAPSGGAGKPSEELRRLPTPSPEGDLSRLRPLEEQDSGAPAPDSAPVPPRRPRWLGAADGALAAGIALGLVGVSFGATALHYDNAPLCDLAPGQTHCRQVGDTLALGVGLTVGGAVLALGATAALVALELRLGRPQAPAATVRLSPLVGPNIAGVAIGGAL